MTEIIEKVYKYILKNSMITPGSIVVAGISGGADSCCLLHILSALSVRLDIDIEVIHINHNIRGEGARHDALFVRDLCRRYGINYNLAEVDAKKSARMWGISTEEAGRILRYQSFRELARSLNASCIAVAHNQNDVAETLLMNMARGTGIKGLCSLRPVRGDIIRPLLCLSRKEIEDFLSHNGFDYCIDVTNGSDEYTRNRIRNNILNQMTGMVNSKAVYHMAQTSAYMQEIDEYISDMASSAYKKYTCHVPGNIDSDAIRQPSKMDGIVLYTGLLKENPVIVKRVISMAYFELSGSQRDFLASHISAIAELFDNQPGKEISLPENISARRIYEGVRLTHAKRWIDRGWQNEERELLIPGKVKFGRYEISAFLDNDFEYCRDLQKSKIDEKSYTKLFDYDKIKCSLIVRTRRAGDKICVYKNGGKKKLKEFFIDQKIQSDIRDKIPIIVCGSDILLIVGYRASEEFRVCDKTKTVLRIETVLQDDGQEV